MTRMTQMICVIRVICGFCVGKSFPIREKVSRVKTKITNRVAEIRKGRGIGASDLARRVDVSRQTIYAIEAGTYVPNTEVALRLAREMEVAVGDLFSLEEGLRKSPPSL